MLISTERREENSFSVMEPLPRSGGFSSNTSVSSDPNLSSPTFDRAVSESALVGEDERGRRSSATDARQRVLSSALQKWRQKHPEKVHTLFNRSGLSLLWQRNGGEQRLRSGENTPDACTIITNEAFPEIVAREEIVEPVSFASTESIGSQQPFAPSEPRENSQASVCPTPAPTAIEGADLDVFGKRMTPDTVRWKFLQQRSASDDLLERSPSAPFEKETSLPGTKGGHEGSRPTGLSLKRSSSQEDLRSARKKAQRKSWGAKFGSLLDRQDSSSSLRLPSPLRQVRDRNQGFSSPKAFQANSRNKGGKRKFESTKITPDPPFDGELTKECFDQVSVVFLNLISFFRHWHAS